MTRNVKKSGSAALCFAVFMMICLLFVAIVPFPVKAEDEITAAADTSAVEIWTYKDLLKVAENPSGSYKLMADIDLKGRVWAPVDFSGSFDGDGHAILNASVNQLGGGSFTVYDGNMISYDARFSGFFSSLVNATVKNTDFWGLEVSVDTGEPTFVGGIAGYMENSTIENCSLYGKATLYSSGAAIGVGGIAGFGTGSITGADSDMTLVCVDKDREYKEEQFLGGAYAAGYIDLTNNTIQLNGYDSDHGYVHNGGLVGMYIQYPEGTEHEGAITGNTVAGQITFFEDNEDRRAYCEAYIGEIMNWSFAYDDAFSDENFTGTEVDDYDTVLLPHSCTDPKFEQTAVASTETENGYTEYHCVTCGYSYKADFLPVIGNYVDTSDIAYGVDGASKAASKQETSSSSGKTWVIIVVIVVVLILIALVLLFVKKKKTEQERLAKAVQRKRKNINRRR